MTTTPLTREQEHQLATEIGFYGARIWWIDSFSYNRPGWYKYWLDGRNGFDSDKTFFWNVPSISNHQQPYAFALKVVR